MKDQLRLVSLIGQVTKVLSFDYKKILSIIIFMTLKNLNFSEEISSYLFTGTVVDSGVFAPVLTFQKLFQDEGVPITSDEVRAPMGVHKRVNTK